MPANWLSNCVVCQSTSGVPSLSTQTGHCFIQDFILDFNSSLTGINIMGTGDTSSQIFDIKGKSHQYLTLFCLHTIKKDMFNKAPRAFHGQVIPYHLRETTAPLFLDTMMTLPKLPFPSSLLSLQIPFAPSHQLYLTIPSMIWKLENQCSGRMHTISATVLGGQLSPLIHHCSQCGTCLSGQRPPTGCLSVLDLQCDALRDTPTQQTTHKDTQDHTEHYGEQVGACLGLVDLWE